MSFKKGEVYLARLNPKKGNEIGKLRPVLIYQTDMLNGCEHPTTLIIPLSTQLIDDTYPLRYRISKRQNLEKTSEVLCDQIRAIDNKRILVPKLAALDMKEIMEIDEQVKIILGILS